MDPGTRKLGFILALPLPSHVAACMAFNLSESLMLMLMKATTEAFQNESLPVVPLVSMHEGSSGLPVLTSVSIVFPLLEFSLPTFQNDWAVHGQAEVVVLSSLAVGCFRCGIWGSPTSIVSGLCIPGDVANDYL